MKKQRLIPLALALLGAVDFIYGVMKPDMVSVGMGALMAGIAVYILYRKEPS